MRRKTCDKSKTSWVRKTILQNTTGNRKHRNSSPQESKRERKGPIERNNERIKGPRERKKERKWGGCSPALHWEFTDLTYIHTFI